MDINSIINMASGNAVEAAIATKVLKKSQELEGQTALQLINALPKGSPSGNGVGGALDIYA